MVLNGFIGPSYTSQSMMTDCERSVNLYVETVESGAGNNRIVLYGTPGLKLLVTLPQSPCRAMFQQDGRCFAIFGARLYEIFLSSPFYIERGSVPGGTSMASICSNGSGGHQLFIVCSGNGYIYDLNANTLTQISSTTTAFPAQATMGLFVDGYFIVLEAASNQFQLSALEDGTQWSGLDVGQRTSASDNISGIVTDHRQVWMLGSVSTEVWYNSGNASFPLQPIPGAFLERGAIVWSINKLDNTLVFIGVDRLGGAIAYRANNFTPQRISTHAVEFAWSKYVTLLDAESFTYQEQGHSYWVINFPLADKTWVYDAATSLWHERDYFDVAASAYGRIRARCHAFEWGVHLVGDRTTGALYLQSLDYYTDAGNLIRRRRRMPHLNIEKKWNFYSQFQLDCEVGQGTSDPNRDPQATLRWSDDWGNTWSNEYNQSMGKAGEYLTRCQWQRLGRSRDRVFETEIAEDMPVRLVNAYLNFTRGTS